MGNKLINISDRMTKSLLCCEFIDDFIGLDTTTWLTLAADAGASVAEDQDGIDGIVTLTTGAVDNNEAYLFTNEIAKFLNGKPFDVLAIIQYAEGNTDDANIIFGIGEGFGAANTLLDNGAGPPADYEGAVFFKVDGGTRWNFETSVGTSQTTTELDAGAGGSAWHTLQLQFRPLSATEYEVTPWIDRAGGNSLTVPMPYNTNFGAASRLAPVKHRFTYTTPGEMALCFGVKAGGGVSEVLNVDLVAFAKKRGK